MTKLKYSEDADCLPVEPLKKLADHAQQTSGSECISLEMETQ